MIKAFLGCSIVFLIFAKSINAQIIEYGPVLGTNLMSVDRDTFGLKYLPNFHLGGEVRFKINRSWSIESGIYFTQKTHYYYRNDTTPLSLFGFEDQLEDIENVDFSVYNQFNSRSIQYFLEVPLKVNFHLCNFSVSVGGYFNYMLFATAKSEETTAVPLLQAIDIEEFDPTGTIGNFLPEPYVYEFDDDASISDLKPIDFGLTAGIGYKLNRIGIEASYNYGLLPYRKDSDKTYQFLRLSINYLFSYKFCKLRYQPKFSDLTNF